MNERTVSATLILVMTAITSSVIVRHCGKKLMNSRTADLKARFFLSEPATRTGAAREPDSDRSLAAGGMGASEPTTQPELRSPLVGILSQEREAAGLVNTAIEETKDESRIQLDIRPKPSCGGGDLNAIALDLEHSPNQRLLLSLESLTSRGVSLASRVITPQEIFQGFRHTFTLPKVTRPQAVGIFLCKDSGNTGSCSPKASTDVNQVYSEYNLALSENRRYEAPDRVYFFQYALLEGNGTLSHFRAPQIADEQFAKLESLSKTLRISGSDADATSTVEITKARTRTIVSLPLRPRYQELTMELPIADESGCRAPEGS